MKKLQKLILNKAVKMTDNQMKNISGGYGDVYDGYHRCVMFCEGAGSTPIRVGDCSRATAEQTCGIPIPQYAYCNC